MGEELRSKAWLVWTALRTEQRAMRGSPLVVIGAAVQPVVLLLITDRRAPHSPDRTADILFAIILTSVWSTTVWMAGGVLRRERSSGTLARCVIGRHSVRLVLLGKCLGATLLSLSAVLASVAVTAVLLGDPVHFGNPGLLVLAMVAAAVSGTGLGMLVACLFLVTRHGIVWSSALMYPVFILGGMLIPASSLPWAIRWIPDLVSLHWVHDFTVRSAAGHATASPLIAVLGLAVGYSAAALFGLAKVVDTARRKGTLDLAW